MSVREADHSTLALQTRGVHKFYGVGRNATYVLRGFDMDAPYGTIYGLLGASGCGKTTLLRCVLGRLPIQSGQILVLGKPPGAKGHSVPGKDVGYMPQETALINEFTMLELMYYFGILFNMNLRYTKKRAEFLKDFLNLPTIGKRCGLLSGGQKRRVSLAAALLHEPPLLILDEPTVGLDPLLRAKIWRHLIEVTSTGNTTIVLTTHYVEEARQAHVVGLMRAGKLLAQSKPDDLIRAFNLPTLEDVLLKLSKEQDTADEKTSPRTASLKYSESTERTPLIGKSAPESPVTHVNPPPYFSVPRFSIPQVPRFFNFLALVWKQFLKFFREPMMFFFIILSPTIQISVFCLAYGRDLHDLKIYYTNKDSNYTFADRFGRLHSFNFGQRFLQNINDDTLDLKFIDNQLDGVAKVKDGHAWGYFLIPLHFTQDYITRQDESCRKLLNPNYPLRVINCTISVHMDLSNQQIYYTVNETLSRAYMVTQQELFHILGIPIHNSKPLLFVGDYVYGGSEISFFDTVTTAVFVGAIIGLSMTLTATQLITERKEGVIDRTWVAGVSVTEVILSQSFAFLLMQIVQCTPVFFFVAFVFNIPREGSLVLAVLLMIAAGMVGVSFGLVLSALLDSEATALSLSIGVYYPVLFIGGILWPIKSVPSAVVTISEILPVFYPAEGIRSILIRGWGLADKPVYLGFIVCICWTTLFLLISGLGLHFKK